MRYYKNSFGAVAKVLVTGSKVVVMFGFRTIFFDTFSAAGAFLAANGYY